MLQILKHFRKFCSEKIELNTGRWRNKQQTSSVEEQMLRGEPRNDALVIALGALNFGNHRVETGFANVILWKLQFWGTKGWVYLYLTVENRLFECFRAHFELIFTQISRATPWIIVGDPTQNGVKFRKFLKWSGCFPNFRKTKFGKHLENKFGKH